MFAITYLSFPLLKLIYQANTMHAGSRIILFFIVILRKGDYFSHLESSGTYCTSSIFRSHTPTHPSQPNLAVQGFPWGKLITTDEQKRQTDTMQVQHLHENFQNCCHMRVIDRIKMIERISYKYGASCGSGYIRHKHQH